MTDQENEELAFFKGQQALVESFKKRLEDVFDVVIGNYYTDLTPWATLKDAGLNYQNKLQAQLISDLQADVLKTELGHYSWAANFRARLLNLHREELQNAIICDLESRIESLEQSLEDMRKWR